MPPRRKPPTPVQQTPAENLPPISEEAREALNTGIKRTVTPRDGEATDLVIRQFYTDQALDISDQLETVYKLITEMADSQGDVDLFEVFRKAREDVLLILARAVERDRKTFIGRLEFDDLLVLFGDVFNINKDFFDLRVKDKLANVFGQVSTMLSNS